MRKYHIHILLIILGTVLYFFAHFQRTAIPAPVFDLLQSNLHVSAAKITTFSAVFMYCYAIGTLFCGILIDKFGGIKVLSCGSIIFTIGSLIFANTDNIIYMYIARGLIGIGAASFYLGLISEAKKCFKDRYLGIIIALILFFGYIGGISANAPFVILSHKFGFKEVLNTVALITAFFTILFIIFKHCLPSYNSNEKVSLTIEPYKEVFLNKNNIYITVFYALCTGLHYTILTVIGIKFLTDYMRYPLKNAALILSVMVVIASFSGIILASICKLLGNKRTIFIKLLSFISFFTFLIISLCIIFNIKSILIPFLILVLAINGGNSPITVPVAMNTNRCEIRGTTISIMNSIAFITVGLLATLIGYLMDLFPVIAQVNGNNIYANKAYFTVFLLFTLFAIIEIIMSYKIKEDINN